MLGWLTDPALVKAFAVWAGALCTLGIYSILYKENRVFRFFEHLFIGLATGYTIYTTWNDVLKPRWWEPMTVKGFWWWAFALPAGLLFYMVYSKRYVWLSRLIFGLFFGAAAGRSFQAFAAERFPQIKAVAGTSLAIPPQVDTTSPRYYFLTPFSTWVNNLLFLVILVSVMTYFFFSFEQKTRPVQAISRFGRYVLMVAFGAIFGSTIMARMSLLIGRIYYLIHDWIQVTILRQGA